MVLWEITLATAYFLGLKRTYRLALKIQRRLISQKRPNIRQFAQRDLLLLTKHTAHKRRTRTVFDVALRFHRNIQERDIEVGRNLGNWILRCLDKMKPSANIRGAPYEGKPPGYHNYGTSMTKQTTNQHQKNEDSNQKFKTFERGSDRHLFSASRPTWPTSFPSITMMMRHPKQAGSTTQYRQLCLSGPQLLASTYQSLGFRGVVREDIRLWMQQN